MRVETELAAADVSSASGLCFPGTIDDDVEKVRCLDVLARRRPILALLERGAAVLAEPGRSTARTLHALVAALDGPSFFRTFAHSAVVTLLRRPEPSAEATARKALEVAAMVVGARDVAAASVTLPAGALPPLLYLVHPNVALTASAAGALTVHGDPRTVVFAWADGTATVLPSHGVASWSDLGSTRLWAGGRVGPWAILNDRAPIHARQASVPAPCAAESGYIAEGLARLASLWPEAAAGAQRWLHDTFILEPAPGGGYYSFTTEDAPGTHFASAVSWVQVGDSLVHELAHARELAMKAHDPLILDDGSAVHPSPWREDPRPLSGLASGIHSFVNVHAYYARLHAAEPAVRALAEERLATHGARLREAWAYLVARARWTPLGEGWARELDRYITTL